MKKVKYKILLLLVLLVPAGVTFGQQAGDSLSHYIAVASKVNPLLLQRMAEYHASLQKVPQAGSLPDPVLNLGIYPKPMELVAGKEAANVQLMQMFPWIGTLKSAKSEMSLMAKASFQSYLDAVLQLRYEMQRSWYEMLKTQENIHIFQKNITILRTIERLSLIRFKTGNSPSATFQSGNSMPGGPAPGSTSPASGMQSMGGNTVQPSASPSAGMASSSMANSSGNSGLADVYRIQIEIAGLKNESASLQNSLETMKKQFNSFLDRPSGSPVILPDSLVLITSGDALQLIADSSFSKNPMLQMIDYENKSLSARKDMVTRMGYPMAGIGLNYSVISKNDMSSSSMNGKDMIMPMVSVTLPVYRKKYRAMQEEINLRQTATLENYKATANSLVSDYYEAVRQLTDSKRQLKLADEQSRLSQMSLDIMVKSFTASGSSLTDILQIRQQLLTYLSMKAEAVASYNTAVAWLERLTATNELQ